MAEGAAAAPGASGMAAVVIDGKRVPLTAAGLKSIRGSKAERAKKLHDAIVGQLPDSVTR